MNKTIIKNVFKDILGNAVFDSELINKYFSTDYVQTVNGITLSFHDFVKHLQALKEKINDISAEIKSIAEEGETVFTNHIATTIMKDGTMVKTKVIAEFRIRNGKLFYCDELTKLIEGKEEHSDLGSTV